MTVALQFGICVRYVCRGQYHVANIDAGSNVNRMRIYTHKFILGRKMGIFYYFSFT